MLEQLKERHLGHLCSLFKRERITSAVLPIFTDADLQKLGVKRQCGRRFCDVRHAGPGGIEAVTSVGCGVVPGNRRGCVGRQLQATEETLLTFQKVLRGAGREEGLLLLHMLLIEDQKRKLWVKETLNTNAHQQGA